MALGREMHDDVVPRHNLRDNLRIADVTLHEGVAGVVTYAIQVRRIARIRECIEDSQSIVRLQVLAQTAPNVVRAR